MSELPPCRATDAMIRRRCRAGRRRSLPALLVAAWIASCAGEQAAAQVTFPMQTWAFNTWATTGQSPAYGAFQNNTSSDMLVYSGNGSAGNTPGVALFQIFTPQGFGVSGVQRSLQVGDAFTIGAYAQNPPAGGSLGISFRDSTSFTSFASATDAATEARFQLDSSGGWKVYHAGTAIDSGVTANIAYRPLTITVTSGSTFNATVDNKTYYDLGMAAGGGTIDSFAVYTVGDNTLSYWSNGWLVATGSVRLGYAATDGTTFTPGTIADGLFAGSQSVVRSNSVFVGGSAGSRVALVGSNSYTGSTTVIANATAEVRHANALGSVGVGTTVSGSGALVLSGSSGISFAAEPLTLNGLGVGGAGGALRSVAGDNTWNGPITLASSSRINADASGGAGSLTIAGDVAGGGHVLHLGADGSSITVSGMISGSGGLQDGTVTSLVKDGPGVLTVTGSNTFTGATRIAAGVLTIAGTNGLRGTSGVSIAGGAGLTYTGAAGTLDRGITVTSGTGTVRNAGGGLLTLSGTLTKNGTVLRLTGGSFAVTGPIVGASSNSDLLVDGTATVTLSTVSTYNGPTFVNQSGHLIVGVDDAIPDGSVVTLGDATTTGTLTLGGRSDTIGGLAFGAGGGMLRMAATATGAAAQLAAATGTMTLTGGTLDLGGSGTAAGLYRLLAAQSIGGTFATVTGASPAYRLETTSTAVNYRQRPVLGTVSVTNPATIITGGSAAFTYTVANAALSGGDELAFSSGEVSANLSGGSSGTAAAAAASGPVAGLVFTGTAIGAGQTGTFALAADAAFGATTASGTVSVTVLDHARSSLAASLLTSTTISLGRYNHLTNAWEVGGDTGSFTIHNLASGFGAELTADLTLLGATGTADGFATNLGTFAAIAGGTSQQFQIFFATAGLTESATKSATFAIALGDDAALAGALPGDTLYVTAEVVVVPEPGAIVLVGWGLAAGCVASRGRRRSNGQRAGSRVVHRVVHEPPVNLANSV